MHAARISNLYEDAGPFASVYLDISRDMEDGDRIVELQARAAVDALKSQGAPDAVVASVQERLMAHPHEQAPISRMVVASERGVLLDQLTRARRPQAVAVWGALPSVAVWIADDDAHVPFVLALVDHEGGDVSVHRSDPVRSDEEASVGEPDPHEHKIPGGGWSHLRYQKVAEGVWASNAGDVAEEIRKQVGRGIGLVLIAGDVKSCQLVKEALGDDLRAKVVQLETGGRSDDGGENALEKAVAEAITAENVRAKLAEVHELKERLGRNDSVAIGLVDVADAFVRGQVDRLLIDPIAAADFEIEPERHPGLALGAVTDLPAKVPADQALVAAAALTNADVIVTRTRTLGGAPVAALLRWDQRSVGAHT